MSTYITPEIYNKKVDDSFFAYGHVIALFKGPEHIDNQVLTSILKNKRKNSIRVFDIILYKDINISDAKVIPNELWESTLVEMKKSTYFHATLDDQLAIQFNKFYFNNVDFLRTSVYRPECFIKNPVFNYSLVKDGFAYGEIAGELYFKVGNPKPLAIKKTPFPIPNPIAEIETQVVSSAPVQPGIGCLGLLMNCFSFSWLLPFIPGFYTKADIPSLQRAGCLWPLLRMFGLLFLMLFLFKGCLNYSSNAWNSAKNDAMKNDKKLDIPTGKEKIEQSDKLVNLQKNKFSDTTFVVPPGNYKLVFFDSNRQDGDKIKLSLNGRDLEESLEVLNAKQEVVLKNMRYGKNIIDFEALSNGKYGICTAEVYLVNMDDGATKMYKFYNEQGFKKRIFIEQH
ncbi:hypothetical protein V7S76_12925 [Aquirufa sp. ROCK2-A2]